MITSFQIARLFETLNYPDWRDAADFTGRHTLDVEMGAINLGDLVRACGLVDIDPVDIEVRPYTSRFFIIAFYNVEYFEIVKSWESNN